MCFRDITEGWERCSLGRGLRYQMSRARVTACFVRVQMPKEGLVDLGIESLTKTPVPDILTGEK